MDRLKFARVIHPDPTKLELSLVIFLLFFIFVPFIYGIISTKIIFCWSLIIGLFGLIVFNYFTDYKFTSLKIIQKQNFINFNEEQIFLEENEEFENFKWIELEQIEIKIFAYKNKYYGDESYYDGMENFIKFQQNKIEYRYLFYIENEIQFNFLKDYFEKIILPKLYQFQNIKDESIIISELNYSKLQEFKREKKINRYTDQIYFNEEKNTIAQQGFHAIGG